MRKLILFLLIYVSGGMVEGHRVSENLAASIASEFFNSVPEHTSTTRKVRHVKPMSAPNDKAVQPYYIFNDSEGTRFVIVSGDDRVNRIIGYSDNGIFDFNNLPPQLDILLKQYAKRLSVLPDDLSIHPSWKSKTIDESSENGVLLETVNWGQGAPYNSQCPIIDGVQAPTGCVATAMSIVMKYHNWPEEYDWDSMPLTEPEAPVESLSKLMKDAGEAVFMNYGANESGANSNWIGHRLQYIFKYSPECQYIMASHFPKDQWVTMLRENLDNNCPVIYSGHDDVRDVGHAFVIDGYRDDKYHINWGWDGFCNGFFDLEELAPIENTNYSSRTAMVINIVPDKTDEEYSEVFTDYGYFWAIQGDMAESMNLSVENVKTGEPFHVIPSQCTFPAGFVGLAGMAIVDKNNNIKEILRTHTYSTWLSSKNKFETSAPELFYFNLVAKCDIESTDRIQLVAKRNDEPDFKLVLGTMERPSYVNASNNTPRYSKVKWDIEEGIVATYIDRLHDEEETVNPGISEQQFLRGLNIQGHFKFEDGNTNDNIYASIRGPQIYGDQQFSKNKIDYSVDLVGDYVIEAKKLIYTSDSIHLENAGTFESLFSKERAHQVRELTLTGHMNAKDFWFIRDNFPSLKSLDISKVIVHETEDTDSRFFETSPVQQANAIPEWALTMLRNLENLILPESLIGISPSSLMSLSLKEIKIPAGVQFIGDNALCDNPDLAVVVVQNPNPIAINDCIFAETKCPLNGILVVPRGASDVYKKAEVWSDFSEIIEGESTSGISGNITVNNIVYEYSLKSAKAIGYEGEIKKVIIPPTIKIEGSEKKVTAIGPEAFCYCQSLEVVELSDNITEIGKAAFADCRLLKNVILSKNLRKIGVMAFSGCYSLEECDIPDSVSYLGMYSFYETGLLNIHIPQQAKSGTSIGSPFGRNYNLKAFTVDERNEVFKAIDGVLYHKTGEGLKLERIPGAKEGDLFLPDECYALMQRSFDGISGIRNVFLNPNLSFIDFRSFDTADGIKHITFPKSPSISSGAISNCRNLESITFTGLPASPSCFIEDCPALNNFIMANSSSDIVNLDNVFSEPVEQLKIFSNALSPNFSYSNNAKVYIPGSVTSNYTLSDNFNLQEMWDYGINKVSHTIIVKPLINDITINGIRINGVLKNTSSNGTYYYDSSDEMIPDVVVEFTLFNRQPLSTHYDSAFNSLLPDNDLNEVFEINVNEDESFKIYDIQGVLLQESTNPEVLSKLGQGIYIIKQGSSSHKVVIQ